MEIGTWSNEMAANINNDGLGSDDEWSGNFPSNIDLCSSSKSSLTLTLSMGKRSQFSKFIPLQRTSVTDRQRHGVRALQTSSTITITRIRNVCPTRTTTF